MHCNDRAGASGKVRGRRAKNERLGLKSDMALTYRVIVRSFTANYLDRLTYPRLSTTRTMIPRSGCSIVQFNPPDRLLPALQCIYIEVFAITMSLCIGHRAQVITVKKKKKGVKH